MTEAEWIASHDPEEMIKFLGDRLSERKLRLFGVACCRRVKTCLTDVQRHVLLVAEQFADRVASEQARAQAEEANLGEYRKMSDVARSVAEEGERSRLLSGWEFQAFEACWKVISLKRNYLAAVHMYAELTNALSDIHDPAEGNAHLLRHIAGNPFRPLLVPPPALPAEVVRLACVLEAGEPVVFALRDALLEAGQTELAEHFAGDEPHPRGCWALDVIGGRA